MYFLFNSIAHPSIEMGRLCQSRCLDLQYVDCWVSFRIEDTSSEGQLNDNKCIICATAIIQKLRDIELTARSEECLNHLNFLEIEMPMTNEESHT